MEINYRYYVCADIVDLDDDGEEQASIYSTFIYSDDLMQLDQIIEQAEEEGDWKIAFGEGDWDLLDTYTIEVTDKSGNTKVIAERYEPPARQ